MRRLVTVSLAVFLATGVASLVSLFSVPEARSATYTQIVDNATAGRFTAPDWRTSSADGQRYGRDYRQTRPGSGKSARFKMRIPKAGYYVVYARWPAMEDNNPATRIGITTADGLKWKRVNQQINGGKWIKLGTYRMAGGDRYSIQVAHNTDKRGRIVADAVKIVRTQAPDTDSGGGVTGADIVEEARRHIGKPYVYGASGPNAFDCSGFTMYVYKKVANISLPHSAKMQYEHGKSVSKSQLKAGDLIFGNAGGSGIQHVGIYDGNGKMIHAGNSETDVEATPFPNSWYNVVGYKRLIP